MSKKCVGCGIILQSDDRDKDGYVDDINKDLCLRCFMIKNYGKYSYTDKNNIDYMKIFDNISDKDLVIYVSSILTLNLDYIDKFKNVILVITKRDIMPKSIKDNKLIKYIKDRYNNILDVEIISSLKNYNLDSLYAKINKYCSSGNMYFVGATNSGKSTLINKLFKNYTDSIVDITTSYYPSTTIDIVPIKFNDMMIYDTPGIVIDRSIINYFDGKELKMVNNKKEIKPRTYQICGSGSLLVEDILRIDYSSLESSITFYVSNGVNIRHNSIKNTVLLDGYKYVFDNIEYRDIVIEDFGYFKVTNKANFNIYCKYDVDILERDNLI